MNSLRARLVLGFAFVALVPLAAALLLIANHVRSNVNAEATERVETATSALGESFTAAARRTQGRLGILARDPALKRAYLVSPPGRELDDFLEERRVLLGLDFLQLWNGGNVVASAISESLAADGAAWTAPWPLSASGITVRAVPGAAALAVSSHAPVLYQGEPVATLVGGGVLDSGVLAGLKQTSGLDLVLRDDAGRTVASTLPGGADVGNERGDGGSVVVAGARFLARTFVVAAGSSRATLTALASTAAAERTIRRLQSTAVALGLFGVGVAIVLGFLWSFSVSRPVERLADFSERIAQGDWDEPLDVRSVKELETLVTALERMRRDLRGYRERLVASERHAAWSLMARQVAHEVRNPLTPIAVSVADLKRSYEQGRPDFPQILEQAARTIGEEVLSLKRILTEFSEFGRLPEPAPAPVRLSELTTNLRALYGADIANGRLSIDTPSTDATFDADAGQLTQALVNLIQNGFEAIGSGGAVRVHAARTDGDVVLEVADDGPGLTPEHRARLFVPEFTTKEGGRGLGLAIVERIVTAHGGTIDVDSEPGRGTTFRLRLPATTRAGAGENTSSPIHPRS